MNYINLLKKYIFLYFLNKWLNNIVENQKEKEINDFKETKKKEYIIIKTKIIINKFRVLIESKC